MYCFVILLLFNEMQMSVRRFSAIPHLRGKSGPGATAQHIEYIRNSMPDKARHVYYLH